MISSIVEYLSFSIDDIFLVYSCINIFLMRLAGYKKEGKEYYSTVKLHYNLTVE